MGVRALCEPLHETSSPPLSVALPHAANAACPTRARFDTSLLSSDASSSSSGSAVAAMNRRHEGVRSRPHARREKRADGDTPPTDNPYTTRLAPTDLAPLRLGSDPNRLQAANQRVLLAPAWYWYGWHVGWRLVGATAPISPAL